MIVVSAYGVLKSGESKGRIIEWRDRSGSGLTLRIATTDVVWYLRHRDITVRIGSAHKISRDSARFIEEQTRTARANGRDIRTFVKVLAHTEAEKGGGYKDDREHALEFANEASDVNTPMGRRIAEGDSMPWTWANLTKHFLAYKLPKLKESYRDSYKGYLEMPAFKRIASYPVPSVRITELEEVRDAIIKKHAVSTAHEVVQIGKAMLTWAWKYCAQKSGLSSVEYEWWQRWSVEYKSKTREHVPLISELVKTLAIVDAMRDGVDPGHAVGPGTAAALWAVVLTGQRIGALVQLERKHLIDDPDRPGWKVAHWTAEQMKGGKETARAHSLPLPPPVVEVIARGWRETDKDGKLSPWVFPSGKSDGHVTISAFHILLHRLEGRRPGDPRKPKPYRKGKPGPKPKAEPAIKPGLVNQLAANKIVPWTPHDVRRSLAHYLDDMGLGGAASAILAHKRESIFSERAERENVAAVTRTHYAFKAQRLPLKAEGMTEWVDKVMQMYERVKDDVRI